MPDDLFSIPTVAHASDCPVPALRYYEERGLIEASERRGARPLLQPRTTSAGRLHPVVARGRDALARRYPGDRRLGTRWRTAEG